MAPAARPGAVLAELDPSGLLLRGHALEGASGAGLPGPRLLPSSSVTIVDEGGRPAGLVLRRPHEVPDED